MSCRAAWRATPSAPTGRLLVSALLGGGLFGCPELTPCDPVDEGAQLGAELFVGDATDSELGCAGRVTFFDEVEIELSSRVEVVGLDPGRPNLRVEVFVDDGVEAGCEDFFSAVDISVESGRLLIRPGAFGIEGSPPQYRFRVRVPEIQTVAAAAGSCVDVRAPAGRQLGIDARFRSRVRVVSGASALSSRTSFSGCIDARSVSTESAEVRGEGEGRVFLCEPEDQLSVRLDGEATVQVVDRPCPVDPDFACAD